MNRVWFSLLLLIAALWPASALGQSQDTDIRPLARQVSGDQIKEIFSGITHDGAYNFSGQGEPRNRYRETHNPDGTVIYREGDLEADGAWYVLRNNLCYLYNQMDMTGGCFRVYKIENCYYFYSARLPRQRNELAQDYWTARSTPNGEPPKCEAVIS